MRTHPLATRTVSERLLGPKPRLDDVRFLAIELGSSIHSHSPERDGSPSVSARPVRPSIGLKSAHDLIANLLQGLDTAQAVE